jgi:glyoxylase-like metal-dependent hydrolase (beta-lactamase superfamily II)
VQLARIKVVPPNLLFEKSLTIDLGGRRVEIRNVGRANSPHDLTIYLPDEQVLFTGDILVSPLPYTAGASPMRWIDVLKQVEAYPIREIPHWFARHSRGCVPRSTRFIARVSGWIRRPRRSTSPANGSSSLAATETR